MSYLIELKIKDDSLFVELRNLDSDGGEWIESSDSIPLDELADALARVPVILHNTEGKPE